MINYLLTENTLDIPRDVDVMTETARRQFGYDVVHKLDPTSSWQTNLTISSRITSSNFRVPDCVLCKSPGHVALDCPSESVKLRTKIRHLKETKADEVEYLQLQPLQNDGGCEPAAQSFFVRFFIAATKASEANGDWSIVRSVGACGAEVGVMSNTEMSDYFDFLKRYVVFGREAACSSTCCMCNKELKLGQLFKQLVTEKEYKGSVHSDCFDGMERGSGGGGGGGGGSSSSSSSSNAPSNDNVNVESATPTQPMWNALPGRPIIEARYAGTCKRCKIKYKAGSKVTNVSKSENGKPAEWIHATCLEKNGA
ncbi:hypothetical protein ScalyP_jg1453 [Parmales sp. scaly parma]|nr:hypothetical protein ScalyP_jg1453 [Parmales sp. scaly parma]